MSESMCEPPPQPWPQWWRVRVSRGRGRESQCGVIWVAPGELPLAVAMCWVGGLAGGTWEHLEVYQEGGASWLYALRPDEEMVCIAVMV